MQKPTKNTNRLLPFALAGALMLMGMGCGEELNTNCDGDNAQPIETFFDSDFDSAICQLNAQNIDQSEKETHLIIKTQNDFERYVNCTEDVPEIDFNEYFILAGMYRHHQCTVFDRQEVLLCDNRIVYKVELLEQICAALTNVSYFVVIDRQYENLPFVFNVKILN
jgi:hypothetical protein